MIKKGDIVRIKPEWQDPGDDKFTWIAIEDEDGGRVRIEPVDIGLPFPPNQAVTTEMLVTCSLQTDVPSERWLQEQIDYAKSQPRTEYGVPFMGKITAWFKGHPLVLVSELVKVKGERGEQDKVRQEALDWLVNEMRENGLANIGDPYIEVGHDGVPWISEGNHRIIAAGRLGWVEMPVEIRYFDGGERKAGGWAPEVILMMNARNGQTEIEEDEPPGFAPSQAL